MMKKNVRCAVIGQHPLRFPWGFDEEDNGCSRMKLEMAQRIMELRQRGVTEFRVACDPGVVLAVYAPDLADGSAEDKAVSYALALGRPAKIYVLRFNLSKIGRVDIARLGQTLTRPAPFLACRIDSLSEQLLIHGFASDCVLSAFILYAYSLHSR